MAFCARISSVPWTGGRVIRLDTHPRRGREPFSASPSNAML